MPTYKRTTWAVLITLVLNVSMLYSQTPPVFTLTVNATDATCVNNGVLDFMTSGTDPLASVNYTVDSIGSPNFPIITANNSINALQPGTYEVTATQTMPDGQSNSESESSLVIQNLYSGPLDIELDINDVLCGGDGSIGVTILQGALQTLEIVSGPNAPLLPNQNNVFDNLSTGTYEVVIIDDCQDQITEFVTISVANKNIGFRDIGRDQEALLPNCDSITIMRTFEAPMQTETAINYPLTVNVTVFLSNGGTEVFSQDLQNGSLSFTQNLPIQSIANYPYTIVIIDDCGDVVLNRNYSLNQDLIPGRFLNEIDCGERFLTLNPRNYFGSYNVDFLDSPTGFDPINANSDHPGPFTTRTRYDENGTALPEGFYSIRVEDECGRVDIDTFTYVNDPRPFSTQVSIIPECDLTQGSVQLRSLSYPYAEAIILSAPSSYVNALPDTVTDCISSIFLRFGHLDPGQYQIQLADVCGQEDTVSFEIGTFQQGSGSASLQFINCDEYTITANTSEFSDQIVFEFLDGSEWINIDVINASGTDGPYRRTGVLRVTNEHFPFGQCTGNNASCKTELARFVLPTLDLSISSLYAFECDNGSYDIAADAMGFNMNYSITSQNGNPINIDNGTDPVFTNLAPALYNIQVSDDCGNVVNRLIEVTRANAPIIRPSNLCEGENGTLSIQGLSFMNFAWWKASDPVDTLSTSNILNFRSFDPLQDAGLYVVNVTYNSPNSCIDELISFNIPSSTNAAPNAGQDSMLTICNSNQIIDLFSLIGQGFDTYGIWEETTNSGGLNGSDWIIQNFADTVYEFVYVVEGLCMGSDSSFISIELSSDAIICNASDCGCDDVPPVFDSLPTPIDPLTCSQPLPPMEVLTATDFSGGDSIDIMNCNDMTFTSLSCDDEEITNTIFASTNGIGLSWEYSVDFDNDGVFTLLSSGNGSAAEGTTTYSSGTFPTLVTFMNDCGASKACNFNLTVDLTRPSPVAVCLPLSAELVPQDTDGDGSNDVCIFSLSPEDIDAGSFDPCGDSLLYSFSADVTDTLLTFDCSDVGSNVVQLWVTNTEGVQSFCTTVVNIRDSLDFCNSECKMDITPPQIVCRDVVVSLPLSGLVIIDPLTLVDSTVADNCSTVSVSASPVQFDCDDIGSNNVVVTAVDESGNSSSCFSMVEVRNQTPPLALCNDITVSLTTMGMYALTLADLDLISMGSNSVCGLATIDVFPNMFDCDDVGDNTVELIVTDESANSSSCMATVTVIDSGQSTLACSDHTIYVNDTYSLNLMDSLSMIAASNGSCGIDTTGLDFSRISFDCGDVLNSPVDVTISLRSDTTVSCISMLTVADTVSPSIVCPSDTVLLCSEEDQNFDSYFTMDNCGIDTVTISVQSTQECGSGQDMITYVVTDIPGNSSSCVRTVEYIQDSTDAIELIFPADTIFYTGCYPGPDDVPGLEVDSNSLTNCHEFIVDFNDVVFSINGQVSECYVIRRSWEIINLCTGEIQIFSHFIFVNNSVAPIITTPNDIIVDAFTACEAFVSISATASDDCTPDQDLIVFNNSPFAINNNSLDASGIYPVGITEVVFTVGDGCGNIAMDTVSVEVQNSEAVQFCVKVFAAIEAPNVTVDVDVEDVTVIIGDCADEYEWKFVVDNVPNGDTTSVLTFDCDDFDNGAGGVNEVLIYLFQNGVKIDSCTPEIMITDPDQLCTTLRVENANQTTPNTDYVVLRRQNEEWDSLQYMPNMNVNMSVDGPGRVSAMANMPPSTVTIETFTILPDVQDICTGYDVLYKWVATDNCGNQDSVSQTISVLPDTRINTMVVFSNYTGYLDAQGQFALSTSDLDGGSFDECSQLQLDLSDEVFDCNDIFIPQQVWLIGTDGCGNEDSVLTTVTLLDTIAPELICPADLTIQCLEFDSLYAMDLDLLNDRILNATNASDNCLLDTIEVSQRDINLNQCNIGTIDYLLSISDLSGNRTQCSVTVLVDDDGTSRFDEIIFPQDTVITDCDRSYLEPPIFPQDGCTIYSSTRSDETLSNSGCDFIVLRTWVLADLCDSSQFFTYTQEITYLQTFEVSCPVDSLFRTADSLTCVSSISLPIPEVESCLSDYFIDVTTPFSVITDYQGELITFPQGITTVEYLVYDNCGNRDSCEVFVIVSDDTAPTCDTSSLIVELQPLECETMVTFSEPIAFDACGSAIIAYLPGQPASGDVFPIGTTSIQYTATDMSGNIAMCEYLVEVEEFQLSSIACRDINLSLDETCMAVLTPEMFLVGGEYGCLDSCKMTVTDEHGQVLSTTVDASLVGKTLDVEVCCGGNCCWSTVTVEYKFPPSITCVDTTVTCLDVDLTSIDYTNFPGVEVLDFCTTPRLLVTGETITDLSCQSDELITQVQRTWIAVGTNGMYSEPCTQTISIERLDLSRIEFPSFTLIDCSEADAVDEDASRSGLGVPIYKGTIDYPLYPERLDDCNIHVIYEDDVILDKDCKKKILRNWQVLEWHCGSQEIVTAAQFIEVKDTTAPIITVRDSFEVTAYSDECYGTIAFNDVSLVDDCSDEVSLSVRSEDGINLTDQIIQLDVGHHEVTLRAMDNCGNTSTRMVTVIVKDNKAPVSVCKADIVASLTNLDTSYIKYTSVDNGSYDACSSVSYGISRNNDPVYTNGDSFNEKVYFTCADLEEGFKVTLRVVDESGNANFCWSHVTVQDKIAPKITCPEDLEVDCDFAYDMDNLSSSFGTAVVVDNCISNNDVRDNILNDVSACGGGDLVRLIELLDSESAVVASCRQTISVLPSEPFNESNILWPVKELEFTGCMDIDLDLLDSGYPTISSASCQLAGVRFDDQVFDFVPGGACRKVVRTWYVIDWCQINTSGGYQEFTFEQTLLFNDETIPYFVELPRDTAICLDAGSCLSADFSNQLEAVAADSCTAQDQLLTSFEIFSTPDNVLVRKGSGLNPQGSLEIGSYEIVYMVSDRCGNEARDTLDLTIENCKAPTPYCLQGLSTSLAAWDTDGDGEADTEKVILRPSYFDAGSYHDCDLGVHLSFSSDVNDTILIFQCEDIGVQSVDIWVTDQYGNQDFCSTFIDVQDNDEVDFCNPEGTRVASLGGNIYTEEDVLVSEVTMNLNAHELMIDQTDDSGRYDFDRIPTAQSIGLTPVRDIDYMQGVSTKDLIIIQRHLLQLDTLDSPYKLIAADINRDDKISAADLASLRKVILGIEDRFTENTSWRFVEATTEFVDPTNPWLTPFDEDYKQDSIVGAHEVDFIATKIGDVSGDISSLLLHEVDNRSKATAALIYQDQFVIEGEQYTIPIIMDSEVDLKGFQLLFKTSSLRIDDVIDDKISISKSEYNVWDDNVKLSKSDIGGDIAIGDVLFKLEVTAMKNGMLSGLLSLQEAYGFNQIYHGNQLEERGAILNTYGVDNETKKMVVLQNIPNPWIQKTEIPVRVPNDTQLFFKLYTTQGQLVFSKVVNATQGWNRLYINHTEVQGHGMYFYEVSDGINTIRKSMVLLE